MSLCALLMVKNEASRISVTVQSLQNLVDAIVLFDTGSDDDTIKIVQETSKIPVHVKIGSFTDFATSRNEALDFADSCGYDYILLVDANEEFIGSIDRSQLDNAQCWYMVYRYKYGPHHSTVYKNIKLIKSNIGIRFVGKVHEYLAVGSTPTDMIHSCHVFQDRTLDDDKSKKRWVRDLDILKEEYEKDPTNTRTLFYLAQTCSCLDLKDQAYKYYKERTLQKGYEEERFYSFLKCGEYCPLEEALYWFSEAHNHSPNRVEPLIALANIHMQCKKYSIAYLYLKLACMTTPNTDMLFVNQHQYDYERWHKMSIVAFYAAKEGVFDSSQLLLEGKTACEIAIKTGCNVDRDEKNLAFYK